MLKVAAWSVFLRDRFGPSVIRREPGYGYCLAPQIMGFAGEDLSSTFLAHPRITGIFCARSGVRTARWGFMRGRSDRSLLDLINDTNQ
jgi:hypothetical protein